MSLTANVLWSKRFHYCRAFHGTVYAPGSYCRRLLWFLINCSEQLLHKNVTLIEVINLLYHKTAVCTTLEVPLREKQKHSYSPWCVCEAPADLSVGVTSGPAPETDACGCNVPCWDRSCESCRENRRGLRPKPATPLVTYCCNELKKLILMSHSQSSQS